jgi:trans-aconitate 2-methyltransferase
MTEHKDWNARQYIMFEQERTRPVKDLLAAVPMGNLRRAIDLGCGPGNSTEVLVKLAPSATISGIDSSPDMITAARKRLPSVQFEVADLGYWQNSEPYDLILANAVLQWLPDHRTLFPKLLSQLAPGGTLAIQIPDNLNEATHRLMREVSVNGPWAEKTANVQREPMHAAEWYYALLKPHCSQLDIWRTTYYHSLSGIDAIIEWVKGTGLRPFLAPLDTDETEKFLASYRRAIAQAYPTQKDGSVLLPFPRLFIVATVPSSGGV